MAPREGGPAYDRSRGDCIPNLFDWATSELSQDAFFCWLIAHAQETEHDALPRVARSFIAWLWNRAHKESVSVYGPQQVTLCTQPRKQLAHTDVFFSARLGDQHVLFLIEDKVRTLHHGDQLQRYATWIEKQKVALGADAVLKIYLKTGYHFDEDRAVEQRGYLLIGLDDLVAFLRPHAGMSEIFDDYCDYVTKMQTERHRLLVGHLGLGQDYVQYDFLRALKESCPEHIAAGQLSHGVNMGGAPWSHYKIAVFPRVLAGVDEVLFLRVDARQDEERKRRHYLSLRQYSCITRKGKQPDLLEAKLMKLARLSMYREIFKEACAAAQTRLHFSRPGNDFQGANESEIGILFFDEYKQPPERVLREWPGVHRALINRLY